MFVFQIGDQEGFYGPGLAGGADGFGDYGGDGDYGDYVGEALGQEGHGLAEDGEQAGGFVAAAAGHQHDDLGFGRQVVAGAEAGGVALVGAALKDGVADEAGGDAAGGEPVGLEREKAEKRVPQAGEFVDAFFLPGPDLGGDVVDAF